MLTTNAVILAAQAFDTCYSEYLVAKRGDTGKMFEGGFFSKAIVCCIRLGDAWETLARVNARWAKQTEKSLRPQLMRAAREAGVRARASRHKRLLWRNLAADAAAPK